MSHPKTLLTSRISSSHHCFSWISSTKEKQKFTFTSFYLTNSRTSKNSFAVQGNGRKFFLNVTKRHLSIFLVFAFASSTARFLIYSSAALFLFFAEFGHFSSVGRASNGCLAGRDFQIYAPISFVAHYEGLIALLALPIRYAGRESIFGASSFSPSLPFSTNGESRVRSPFASPPLLVSTMNDESVGRSEKKCLLLYDCFLRRPLARKTRAKRSCFCGLGMI